MVRTLNPICKSAMMRLESKKYFSPTVLLYVDTNYNNCKEELERSIGQLLSDMRSIHIRARLKSDLDLSQHKLKEDFNGFMEHAIQLADVFQLVDNGESQAQKRSNGNNGSSNIRNKEMRKGRRGNDKIGSNSQRNKKNSSISDKELPLCLYKPHKSKSI